MADDPFQEDPFGPPMQPVDARAPVVRPRPGARGGGFAPPAERSPIVEREEPLPAVRGDNPLLVAAHPILILLNSIRGSAQHANPSALREELSGAIRQFETEAARLGAGREAILAARYVLCTALDEAVATTPWGGGGVWGAETLLVRFHSENWGGEKVFALLDRLAEDPSGHAHLLELIHVTLALGLTGKYHVMSEGKAKLDQLRERLFGLITAGREPVPAQVALAAEPAAVAGRRWLGSAPFWAVGALALSVALLTHIGLNFALAGQSDDVFASILAMKLADRPALPAAAAKNRGASPLQTGRPGLTPLLANEVQRGVLSVSDEATLSLVVVNGDGFFSAGRADISAEGHKTIAGIARALGTTAGPVLVTGHTDSQPIRTARFPSNWHLSKARAEAVVAELSRYLPAGRMKAEGKAASDPLGDNATANGRAANRRVEIRLFPVRERV